ncbi:cell wall protein DAN4-like [Haliotis rufescens]|uniref:cell wall protein DAN4-like n=1 Tax=Haliotis rufescens TaxID=6454 RepID=UPI00201F7F91|nr:cell wall protein DAN4-like [Haliotis rufescens]
MRQMVDVSISKTCVRWMTYRYRRHASDGERIDIEDMCQMVDVSISKTCVRWWTYRYRRHASDGERIDIEDMRQMVDVSISKTCVRWMTYRYRRHASDGGRIDIEDVRQMVNVSISKTSSDGERIDIEDMRVQCDSLWGKTFYIYKDSRTWNEARKICESNGRRLAQIDNKQTVDALLAQGHFWIGLNRADNALYHRWDHCESTDGSSFTFWAEEPATDKKCVFAENDILRWKNEVCDSSSYQYLCQEDTGPCTYTDFSGTCTGPGHAEASVVPGVDVAECEDLCSNILQNRLACWMYSYDNPTCTLYFDTDPWACTQPSLAATAKTRVCFTFDAVTSSSSYSNSNTKPIINCDSYTTQPATTSTPTTTTSSTTTATTTTTTTGVATSINTIAPAVITTSTSNIFEVYTSPENTTSISTNNGAAAAEPTATSNSDTATAGITETTTSSATIANISMATNPTTPATANITMATNPTPPTTTNITMATTPTTPATANITMTANPTTPTTTNITMATTPTTPATESITTTTTPTTTATGSITMATNHNIPTTASITMATTTTNPASTPAGASPMTAFQASTSTATDSSGNNETCPCLVCVETKNMTEIQRIVDALLLRLTLDKSKLSSTRRKLESVPDGRPSAQAIGYSGITFIVITISFFLLSDMIRLCQFFQDKKSNPQSQIRNNTA